VRRHQSTITELRVQNARLQHDLTHRTRPQHNATSALHLHIRRIVFTLHPDRNKRKFCDRDDMLKRPAAALSGV